MYAIAGATGKTGSVVAQRLLDEGKPVRVIVRDAARGEPWRARGAEVMVASLDDTAALSRALAGSQGFFVLLPEDPRVADFHASRRRMAGAIGDAVAAARPGHVVMLSSTMAALPDVNCPARGLGELERILRETAPRLTILRAAYQLENVLAALAPASSAGIYPSFLASADLAFPMVATVDVGRIAARCLLTPPERTEVIDVLGPVTSTQALADALGRALDKPLRVVDVPPAAQAPMLIEAGLSKELAAAVAEVYAILSAGGAKPAGDRMLVGTTTVEELLATALKRVA